MPVLIVSLPRDASHHYAFVMSGDGQRAGNAGYTSLDLLPPGGRGVEVVAVVPASQLSWHRVTLPRGVGPRSPRLPAILAGLLEDRLLQEPAQLHFALGAKPAPDGQYWVAVCARDWLVDHLQALEESRRPAARIVPELAPNDDATAVLATGQPEDAWLLATGPAVAGGVLALPLTAQALALVLPEGAAVEPEAEEHANWQLMAEPAVAEVTEHLLGAPAALVAPAQRLLDAGQSPWNLAQGPLARGGAAGWLKRLSHAWRQLLHAPLWRPLRWGLVALLLVQVVGLNLWRHQVDNDLTMRRARISNALIQTFDHVKVVVDAPVQMEREVAALRHQAGSVSGADLEPMLAAWASAAGQAPTATGLEFSPGNLRLQGIALDEDARSRLRTQLQQKGYQLQTEGDALVLHSENQP